MTLASLPTLPSWLVQTGEASKVAGVFLLGLLLKSPLPENYFRGLALKGALTMSDPTVSPFIAAIEKDLPALIRGTEAVAKALLDTIYKTGTPAEKAAQLTGQLEPGFNKGVESLGLPGWALGMLDGVFAKLVEAVVVAVEAS